MTRSSLSSSNSMVASFPSPKWNNHQVNHFPTSNVSIERKQLLSDRQEDVLTALIDTLLPSLPVPIDSGYNRSGGRGVHDDGDSEHRYWGYQLSNDPLYRNVLDVVICYLIPQSDRTILQFLLTLLSTKMGTFLLFWGEAKKQKSKKELTETTTTTTTKTTSASFDKIPFMDRVELLSSLEQSRILVHRKIFQGIQRLLCGVAFTYHDPSIIIRNSTIGSGRTSSDNLRSSNDPNKVPMYDDCNPFWQGIGYSGPLPPPTSQKKLADIAACNEKKDQTIKDAMVTFSNKDTSMMDNNSNNDVLDEYDIIIVGSGAGGCVASYVLSQIPNVTILVIEASTYQSPNQINHFEADSMQQMYTHNGFLTTADSNILILAGATLGGGTTINWSCCLPLPDHVVNEWNTILLKQQQQQQQRQGTDLLKTDVAFGQEYYESLDTVLNQIGASYPSTGNTKQTTKIHHNHVNKAFIRGCEANGYPWSATGQNLKSTYEKHNGFICFGNKYSNKNDGIQAFLQYACATHQVHILTNCKVQEVIVGHDDSSTTGVRKRVTGVECVLQSTSTPATTTTTTAGRKQQQKRTIKARKAVILAAGALQTPCILQRSNFKSKHIGKHLHLHPVAVAVGCIGKNTDSNKITNQPTLHTLPMNCYYGSPMTTVCNVYEMGPLHNGYGCKIECPLVHPGVFAAVSSWLAPEMYRTRLQTFKYMFPIIALARDIGEGTVTSKSNGELLIHYKVSEADKDSLIDGIRGAIHILIGAGMNEIYTASVRDTNGLFLDKTNARNKVNGKENALVDEYMTNIQKWGIQPFETTIASAHQMGSCRMSSTPQNGVVDWNGETWECNHLYIMDTSIFPTASGSNPMVTVLTLAYMLSKRLSSSLQNSQQTQQQHPKSVQLGSSNNIATDGRSRIPRMDSEQRQIMRQHGFPLSARKIMMVQLKRKSVLIFALVALVGHSFLATCIPLDTLHHILLYYGVLCFLYVLMQFGVQNICS